MRNKSENEARDRYARRYAAALAVESLVKYRGRGLVSVIVVEAEDNPRWDDILKTDESGTQDRYQVKRQQTELGEDSFATYVKAAAEGDPKVRYHFAFPVLISVKNAGEIRVLRTLCERVQQKGAQESRVLKNLRDAERGWIDSLLNWTSLDEAQLFQLLQRIKIEIIGFEEDLTSKSIGLLEPIFGHRTEEAWEKILSLVNEADGVVELHPKDVSAAMPHPAADEVETLYWNFVEEVERCLCVNSWAWLTDHLVRNLLPLEFYEGGFELQQSVNGTVWPGRHPGLEAEFKNLAQRACAFLKHFEARSYTVGEWIKEDKSFKSIFPNPRYHEESEASNAWQLGNQTRLADVVVAMNRFYEAVRKDLLATYRLRDGKLGIHDPMGVTNELRSVIYYPDEYSEDAQVIPPIA